MKTCPNCGKRVYREEPSESEYGIDVVDGRRYPKECPDCGAELA